MIWRLVSQQIVKCKSRQADSRSRALSACVLTSIAVKLQSVQPIMILLVVRWVREDPSLKMKFSTSVYVPCKNTSVA